MADLGNQKIKNTYQFVLQADGSGNLQQLDGTTPNPLIINGNLRYVDGNQATDYVLTSDSSGNAVWKVAAGGGTTYWSANTDGSISPSGLTTNIGIGTSTPNEELTVMGSMSATTALKVGTPTVHTTIQSQYIKYNNSNRIFLSSSPASIPSKLQDDWQMVDGDVFYFGTGEDLGIYHNGANSYIDNNTGSLFVGSSTLYLGNGTSETIVQDNLTVNDNLTVGDDLTVNTDNLYVDSSNNKVGVGTVTPDATLTVSGSSLTAFTFYNLNGGTAQFANGFTRVRFASGASTAALEAGDQIQIVDGVGDTYTVNVASITDSDNILLDVAFPGATVTASEFLYNGAPATGGVLFNVYNSTSPAFQVSGDTVMSGTTDLLDIFATSAITNQDVYWSASTSGGHIINSGLTGNVGIGTDSPDYKLDVAGNIGMNEYLYHNSDADTYLRFAPDEVNIVAGGKSIIKLDESGTNDKILINNSNANIDLNVMADDGSVILSTDATNNRVGVNASTPSQALEVSGSISASTHIHADKVYAADGMYHSGNEETYINFPTGDKILAKAGDTNFIFIHQRDTQADLLTFNENSEDMGITFRSATNNALKIFSSTGDIGMYGVSSPEANVHVGGDFLTDSHITTKGNLNVSGDTSLTAGGTTFGPRPNIYFFANCDTQTVGPASDGSLPSTNTTDVSFSETLNSHAAVYSLSSDELTISRAGLYKFTYNVTLEGGADGTTSNRTGGVIGLLQDTGSGYSVVQGTKSYVYCRIANIEKNTGSVSVIYSVTANEKFKIVFARTGAQSASSKLGTITAGTAWTVEAVT